jgi:hypothetical protein
MKKTKHEIFRFKIGDTLYIIEYPNLLFIAVLIISSVAGGLIHYFAIRGR